MNILKLKSTLEKLESENKNVRENNVGLLHSKIQSKILDCQDILQHFKDFPSILLNWINKYQIEASNEILMKILFIIFEISKIKRGAVKFVKYGAVEFFCEFKSYQEEIGNQHDIIQYTDAILENLVNIKQDVTQNLHTDHSSFITESNLKDSTNKYNQNSSGKFSAYDSVQSSSQKFQNNNDQYDFQQTQKYNSNSERTQNLENLENQLTNVQQVQNATFKKFQPTILQKPKDNTERYEFLNLPSIQLTDNDEKFLFDIGVQLKFGDFTKVKEILKNVYPQIIEDYPIEAFRIKPELVQELVIYKEDEQLQFLAIENQINLIKKMQKSFHDFYTKVHNQNINKSNATQQFLRDDKNYIQQSQPSLNIQKIEQAYEGKFEIGGQLSFYEILELIMMGSFPLIETGQNIGNIYQLWRQIVEFLLFIKNKKPQLVQQLVFKYVKRFSKFFDSQENIYNSISNVSMLEVSVELFMILEVKEYESEKASHLIEKYFEIVLNPKTKCILTQKQIKNLFAYSEFFNPIIVEEDAKLNVLLESMKKYKEFESENYFKRDISFISSVEFQHFIEILNDILVSLPFAQNPNLPKLYVDSVLFSFTDLYNQPGSDDRKFAQTTIELLIKVLQVPEPSNIPFQVLEQIYENLHSTSTIAIKKIIQNPQNYLKQNLMLQILSNSYFATQLTLTCLSNEKLHLLYLDIVSQYIHLNPKFSIYYTFLPQIQVIAFSQNTICAQKALQICDTMKNRNQWNFFGLAIMDLFSKDQSKRLKASQIITNEKIQESIFSDNKNDTFNLELILQTISKQTIQDKLLKKTTEIDFLEDYISNGKILGLYNLKNKQTQGDILIQVEDLLNLVKVITNPNVETSIRSSALEQIGDLILTQRLPRKDQKFNQLMNQLAEFTLKQILEINLNQEDKNLQIYVAYNIQLLNIILVYSKDKIDSQIKESYFLGFFPKYLKQITQQLIINLVNFSNSNLRYQTLQLLQILHFNNNLTYKIVLKDNLESNFMCHEMLENNYFYLIDPIYKNKVVQNIWSLYPLNEMQQFYIDKFMIAETEEELSQSITFSLQKQQIQEINNKIQKSIDINSFYHAMQIWYNLYLSQEEYTEEFFSQSLVPTFQKLIAANTHNLQTIYQENNKNAQEKMNLSCFYFIKLLKRTDENSLDYYVGLKVIINDISDFICTQQLAFLHELPIQNVRERLESVLNILETLIAIVEFAYKTEDVQLRNLIIRKVAKQQFIGILSKIFQQFPNNEQYLDVMVRFGTILMQKAEIMGNLDLSEIQKTIAEFLLIHKPSFDFQNKQMLKNLLKFILNYGSVFTLQINGINYNENGIQNKLKSKQIILQNAALGWIIKYTEDREMEVRMLAWNILNNLAQVEMVSLYKSLIDHCLSTIFATNESYGVVTLALRFLSRILEIYENEVDYEEQEQEDQENDKLTKKQILQSIHSRSFLSHSKNLLNRENAPPIFYASLLQVLRQIVALDSQTTFATLSQIEIWEIVAQIFEQDFFQDCSCLWQVEILMVLSNCSQFLIFTFCQNKDVLNYILNCTNIISNSLNWLKKLSFMYNEFEFKTNFESLKYLDLTVQSIVKLLHCCIRQNEDLTTFLINKKFEEKQNQSQNQLENNDLFDQQQKIQYNKKNLKRKGSINQILNENDFNDSVNIFLTISDIINRTNNQNIIFTMLGFLAPLLGSWSKGHHLLDLNSEAQNQTIAQILMKQAQIQYQGVNQRFLEKQDSYQEFSIKRNQLLQIVSSLLASSNQAKYVFVGSNGFLDQINNELLGVIDFFIVEDQPPVNQGFSKTQTNKKTGKILGQTVASRTGVFGQKPIQQNDIVYYLVVFKCLFAELTNNQLNTETLFSDTTSLHNESFIKNMSLNNKMYQILYKLMQLSLRNDTFMEDFSKILINFSSNKSLSKSLSLKLVDFKILSELCAHILKFETVSKISLSWAIKVISSLSSHKELRQVFYRTSFVSNMINKLYQLWNKKQSWNINNFYAKNILFYLVSLSFYPDASIKILNDKQQFEMFMNILEENGLESQFSKNIILILTNCSIQSDVKAHFINSAQVPPIIMTLITSEELNQEYRAIGSQFIYNLTYKSNQSIQIFNREDIVNEIKFNQKEAERSLEKLKLSNKQKQKQQEQEEEIEESQEIIYYRRIANNLIKVLGALENKW